ncbi:MAG: tetratricopeptide repeat protein [Candidatus Omnitrophota bacterium]
MGKGTVFWLLCFMLAAHAARADDLDDLVNKNLALRQQMEALETKCSSLENERDVLIMRVKELQRQNDLLEKGEAAKGITVSSNELNELKKKLDDASKKLNSTLRDRDNIQNELKKAQKKLSDVDSSITAEVDKKIKNIQTEKTEVYKVLQNENAALKGEVQKLKDQLQKSREADPKPEGKQKSEEKPLKSKQNAEVPDDISRAELLRVQLDKLESDLKGAKKSADEAKKESVAAAERAKKLKMQTDIERLDMHFNLAVVYEKNGMYADAEREYYKCLQLDPNDADVHYNLGILYDDRMNKTSAALVHYKRYLELRPKGESSEDVRQWIFNAEQESRLGVEAR